MEPTFLQSPMKVLILSKEVKTFISALKFSAPSIKGTALVPVCLASVLLVFLFYQQRSEFLKTGSYPSGL